MGSNETDNMNQRHAARGPAGKASRPSLQPAKPAVRWSRPLRVIHLLLALAVTAQLVLGSLMQNPHPGRPDSPGFKLHVLLGFLILACVVMQWGWSVTHPEEGLRHLFPWSRKGLRGVAHDLRNLRRWRLPLVGRGGLAGFVQGLGLLALTAAVAFGASFYALRAMGVADAWLETAKHAHDVFVLLVWIYLAGHVSAALLHVRSRQPVLRRMFDLRAK